MTATKKTKTKTRKPRTVTVKKPVSLDLPRNPFVFEVLDLVSKQRTKAKKIEVLKRYEDMSLKAVLIWNFDESLVSILPDGEVPYNGYDDNNTYTGGVSAKISEEVRSMHAQGNFSLGVSDGQGHTTIRREWKHFYRFLRGGDDGMNNLRRESMFINILEGLHPLEAEIVILCKDKRLGEVYKITQDIVAAAYPDVQWGNRT
tara:strand:+ start:1551 stop:2156 length:606 start_codon:yes stop_codon:yes gene_type:complete